MTDRFTLDTPLVAKRERAMTGHFKVILSGLDTPRFVLIRADTLEEALGYARQRFPLRLIEDVSDVGNMWEYGDVSALALPVDE